MFFWIKCKYNGFDSIKTLINNINNNSKLTNTAFINYLKDNTIGILVA